MITGLGKIRKISFFRIRDIENRLVVAKGDRGGGGMECEIGVSRCKLLWLMRYLWVWLMNLFYALVMVMDLLIG